MGHKGAKMRKLFQLVAILAGCAATGAALAQTFPARPVRMVVPYSQGTATDNVARLFAQKLGESWSQQAVVENQPGANGIIGTEAVARAPKDGHTLAVIAANHVVSGHLYSKLPYDPVKDFAAISIVGQVPFLLVVHPSVAARSAQELAQLARAQPGRLSYGSAGSGSPPHLSGEMFKSLAKVDILHVPYKGLAPALTDLLGGQVQMVFPAITAGLPHVRSGKLRALGVTSLARSPAAPDLPTLDEQGLSGFEVVSWIGFVAPAGTPAELIAKLHADVAKVLAAKDVRERLAGFGVDIVGSTTEQMAQVMAHDSARWGRIVRESGAKLD